MCRAGGSCDSEPELYLDTCATQHVFRDVSLFRGAMRKCGPVEVANKELAAAEGVGRAVAVLRDVDDQEYEVSFEEVRCCANFSANLVSWPQLRQKGFVLLENAEGLRHPSGVVFPLVPSALGPRFVVARGGPRGAAAMAVRGAPVVETGADREMRLWHERTGHLHERGLRELSTKGVATGVATEGATAGVRQLQCDEVAQGAAQVRHQADSGWQGEAGPAGNVIRGDEATSAR